jgi:hypothetical protein
MPLLKTKDLPVADAPNCESWANVLLTPDVPCLQANLLPSR